jgi:large subunit ribosomal protein L14
MLSIASCEYAVLIQTVECFLIYIVGRTLVGSLGNSLFGAANSSVEAVTRPSHCDAISQVSCSFCAEHYYVYIKHAYLLF